MRLNAGLLAVVPLVVSALAHGDDGLLKVVVRGLEARGFKVVGAHQVVPELVASEGLWTKTSPQKADWRDIEAARAAAEAIGALDIGQGAVAVGGRAIALEGIEGTDAMLERVRDLRGHGRLAGKARAACWVKCAKPGQELRADMPAVGPADCRGRACRRACRHRRGGGVLAGAGRAGDDRARRPARAVHARPAAKGKAA